jgi:hypothetical protein
MTGGGGLRNTVRTQNGLVGQISQIVSSLFCKNILLSSEAKSPAYSVLSRPIEGRIMIVTNVRRDAVDADALLTNSA